MSILDEYLKEKEMSGDTLNNYVNDTTLSQEEIEYYKKEEKLQNEFDIEKQYQRFHQMYVKRTEEDLMKNDLTVDSNVRVVVRRVMCPKCGKELISQTPVIYNAFTQEKIAKHDCECGYKCNLEYAYPRVVFVDENNNEVKAFSV